MAVRTVQVAGKAVGPIGYGLMGLTWRANPISTEAAIETMRAAVNNGKLIDYYSDVLEWRDFYGPKSYNSLVLLQKYFEKYPEDAGKVALSVKSFANTETMQPDSSSEHVRKSIDDMLAQLGDKKKMDTVGPARRDENVPMQTTFGIMDKEYIEKGKIGGIHLSEVRAETIHEAVKHFKILGVENEVSMFSPEVLTNGVAEACAKYNIPIFAYSPIGRGMLTGKIRTADDVPADSILKQWPRFQAEAIEINLELVRQVEEMAAKKGCTPAQFAINWVRCLSKRPGMPTFIPIPGATTVERVNENSKIIDLTDEEMEAIDAIVAKFKTAGNRYPSHSKTDT